MADRHKSPGLHWHPPADLGAWAKQEAERRGGARGALSALLTAALAAYREACGGRAVESTVASTAPAEAPPRKPAAKRARQDRPGLSDASLAQMAERDRRAAERRERRPTAGETCGHVYPDVKYVMGQRVCRICD